jgi:hypothetical protein
MSSNREERDQRALEALAIWAEAITDPATRRRFERNPEETIDAALQERGHSIADLPDAVVEFFLELSVAELKTLATLQTTMVAVRDQGFTSLAEDVEVFSAATVSKL